MLLLRAAMSECTYQSSLASYYDGQMPPETARDLERHLATCGACAGELNALSRISRMLETARPAAIHPDELARVHEAVDEIDDRGVLRLVIGLSGIAASILIISAAWLYDGPRPPVSVVVRPSLPEQTWERMASSGPMVDQPTGTPVSGTAIKDTTDWMIVGMGGEHGNR
jgi:anti-sigma factor RsiW